jgi:hypothetical protein
VKFILESRSGTVIHAGAPIAQIYGTRLHRAPGLSKNEKPRNRRKPDARMSRLKKRGGQPHAIALTRACRRDFLRLAQLALINRRFAALSNTDVKSRLDRVFQLAITRQNLAFSGTVVRTTLQGLGRPLFCTLDIRHVKMLLDHPLLA